MGEALLSHQGLVMERTKGKKFLPLHLAFIMQFVTSERQFICS